MTNHEILFTVPIGRAGRVVCSTPVEKVYVLEFTSPPDNRLMTVSVITHAATYEAYCAVISTMRASVMIFTGLARLLANIVSSCISYVTDRV